MDKKYFEGVEQALEAIYNQNEKCIVMLGAILPSTLDNKPMVSFFTFRNDKLAARCTLEDWLEHARPGKHLLGVWGPIDAYFDGDGNINDLGGDAIARALERKIYSARLLQRWETLNDM